MGFLSTVGKIAGIAGAVTGNPALMAVGSISGAIDANKAAQESADKQMAFQQTNSDTAYQRAMKDMQAAGLNPMIAYSQGGASTPSGASAAMKDVITPALSTAQQSQKINSNIQQQSIQNQNIQAQTANTKAQTLTNATQADLNQALKAKALADASLSATSAKATALQSQIRAQDLPGAQARAKKDSSWAGQNIIPWLGHLNPLSGVADTAAKVLK